MGLRGNSDQRFVTGRIDRAGEQFGADPVGALGEDAAAVQLDLRGGGAPGFGKAGGFAPGPLVHHQTDAAETDPLLHAFQITPCGVAERVARGVQRGFPVVVGPPQPGVLQPRRERLSDGSFGPGRAAAAVVEEFPDAAAFPALRAPAFDPQIGAGQVVVEGIDDIDLPEVGPAADLEARFVPDTQRDEPRMPVPAVAHGGFHGGRSLRAVVRHSGAFGNGKQEYFEPVAGVQVRREVDLHGCEHAFAGQEERVVEADFVAVVDPLRYEPELPVLPEPGGVELRAVGEETVLHPRHAAVVVRTVVVGIPFGAGHVELHGARNRRRNEPFRHGFPIRRVSDDPRERFCFSGSDHRLNGGIRCRAGIRRAGPRRFADSVPAVRRSGCRPYRH